MPNCREVATLVMAGDDRRLNWIERLRVRSHLMICPGCSHFTRQVALLGQALQHWPTDPGDAEP